MTLRLNVLKQKISLGQYELSSHAKMELEDEGWSVLDVKRGIYSGKIIRKQRDFPGRIKYVVRGKALDNRMICIACRLTPLKRLRILTVFEE